MSRDKFRTVVKGLITHKGQILIGQKEEDEDHPIGGEWHILGGHLEHGEQPEEAMKREAKEETGLEVEVHQVIDVMTWSNRNKALSVLYHCEASSSNAEAKDDLQELKWVSPDEIKDFVHEEEVERLEKREEQAKFLEKIRKSPF
ncbi:NUDIX domain-containing protein [Nanohaloarchaea archaeon H01]|nr:NUDIX domain-containing protein [Nanohaloarchaea archaeon H01]